MKSKTIVTAAVIITAIVTGIVMYCLTLPPAPTPEVEVRGNIRIMSYRSYIENNTVKFFVVVGEVKNNLTTNVKSARINATFYDNEDQVVGTSYSYTALEILKPEQKAPFWIYWGLNLSTSIPFRTELTCTCFKTSEQPLTGIEISKQMNSTDKDGYYTVSGEAQNNGPRKASAVWLVSTYYDPDGSVIAVSRAYVSPEINVGAKATFTLSSKPYKISPASYELLIVAQYEPLFHTHYPLFFILVATFAIFIAYMKRRGW